MSEVYSPSEDTFLLVDALAEAGKGFRRAVDVGSGSGEVSKKLSEVAEEVYTTDISSEAARATLQALKKVGAWERAHVVCCDMLSAYRAERIFDLVASNPPYLEPEEVGDAAVEGGEDFIARLLRETSARIKRGGLLLFVASTRTRGLEEILREAHELGFKPRVVKSLHLFFEELKVIRANYGAP